MPQLSLDDIASQEGLQAAPPSLDDIASQAGLKPVAQQAPTPVASAGFDNGLNLGAFPSIGTHALADVATVGRDLLNVPHNIVNSIPAYQPNFNYYNALGVQPNLVDKLGVGATEYAPYEMGAGEAVKAAQLSGKYLPLLAQNVLGGAAFGAANSPTSTLGGTAEGAALGVASTGVGLGLSGTGRLLANAYAKSALPGLISKGTDAVMGGLSNPDNYTAQLAAKFKQANTTNNANWEAVAQKATNLDNQVSPDTFNVNPYKNYITNFLSDVDSKTPKQQAAFSLAKQFAQNELNELPENFTDLVTGRQLLNQSLQKFNTKNNLLLNDSNTAQFVKGLKGTLGDTLDANQNNVDSGTFNDLKQSWQNANQSHQDLKAFTNSTNAVGANTPSRVLNAGFKGGQNTDSAILNQFIPAPTQTGTNEYQNLANLYGSRDPQTGALIPNQPAAQQALTSYQLRNANANGTPEKAVMDLYQKQSPQQQQYLFNNTPAQPYLQAANQGIANYGKPVNPKGFWQGTGHYGLHLGLLGGGTALGAATVGGMPWEDALALGAGVAGAKYGVGKAIAATARPGLSNFMMNYGKSAIKPGLARAVNYGAQPLINRQPQPLNLTLTNYAGTQ